MNQQIFYVPKGTGTLTDALLAFGFAAVLDEFLTKVQVKAAVTLEDGGGYYIIDAGVPIQEAWLNRNIQIEPIPFVSSGRRPPPEDLPGIRVQDVDATWDRFRAHIEQQKQAQTGETEQAQIVADLKPPDNWTVTTYIGDFRMQAQDIHNKLVTQWLRSSRTFASFNLRTLFALFAEPYVAQDAVADAWMKATKAAGFDGAVTASQIFNPHMGKGQNRTKANKLTMGNEKSFWLLEYLKAVGLWTACAPTATRNANLRKTYVLAPQRLDLRYHQRVFSRFRDRLWNEGAVKQDIVAALLYTEVLLEQSIANDNLDIFDGGGVSNVVRGMYVATYQLLSQNAYTTMNLSFLGLPDWMPAILSSSDAEEYIAILREHRERIRAIDEERSEGYALLHLYRDFVSGGYIEAFFEFLADYSNYLTSALDRGQFYIKPFTETNLRRLLTMTEPQLSEILENEGFRNIAYAIRMSTVIPLYIGRSQSHFDIRYGLGQELKRKAQYPEDFAQALADFIQSYNDETIRVYERTKGRARRKLITTQDIEQVMRLIDRFGSKTVGNLLVAFGYARDSKEREKESAPTDSDESEAL